MSNSMAKPFSIIFYFVLYKYDWDNELGAKVFTEIKKESLFNLFITRL